jgi:hypothetical protein
MSALTPYSLATVVHLHLAELRREAEADRVVRVARSGGLGGDGRRGPATPSRVARALREGFARPTPASNCPTC